MKALVKEKAEPGIWMGDVPEPVVGHNDVLIRISKTAICGTDIHIFEWNEWASKTGAVPMHIGHEFSGEVGDLGSARMLVHVQRGKGAKDRLRATAAGDPGDVA